MGHGEFLEALDIAMTKAGADRSAVTVYPVVLDRTWGDRDGYLFTGDETLAEKAAKWAAKWWAKHAGKTGYDKQNCAMYRGKAKAQVFGLPGTVGGTTLEGHATSTFYYPCAD